MRRVREFLLYLVFCLVLFTPKFAQASIIPLEIFSTNGDYYDDPGWDLFVETFDIGSSQMDFVFHNESDFASSIARIYFENQDYLSIVDIINGPGVSFNLYAAPGNLPSGKNLEPPFSTVPELTLDADPSPVGNGINPGGGEWLKVTCNLENGATFASIDEQLTDGSLRLGVHVIALPDGSSEGGVNVPEPATVCLLGLSALTMFRKNR